MSAAHADMGSELSELDSREVWRVSYGTADRQYLDAFTNYGVALVGTWGIEGEWPSARYSQIGSGARASIKTVAEKVKEGDIVLATRGFQEIGAVGLAADDPETGRPYRYNPAWVEIEGWDLYHQIRVRCLNDVGSLPRFSAIFPRAYSASRVGDETVRGWARKRIAAQVSRLGRLPLEELPGEEPQLNDSDLRSPFREALHVTRELQDAYGAEMSENTIVAHQIVPLLRGLGFKPSQIRLEWKRMDVAVVEDRNWDRPILIVEARRHGRVWPRPGSRGLPMDGAWGIRHCSSPMDARLSSTTATATNRHLSAYIYRPRARAP